MTATELIEFHENCRAHLPDFVRLNERWIAEFFEIEEVDRELARDPEAVIRRGDLILTVTLGDAVVGCCALFRHADASFELARMAVDPPFQGRGIGAALVEKAIERARGLGGVRITLLTNTVLAPAIALYRRHGFETVREGPHPDYTRCNLVLERSI